MTSPLLLSKKSTNGTNREHIQLLQEERQAFDMAIDEALDGLSEVQQILGRMKLAYCLPGGHVAPRTKLKIQRAYHHTLRIIAEIQDHLQPLSSEEIHIEREKVFGPIFFMSRPLFSTHHGGLPKREQ
jgi:hypothetical protein